VGIACAVCRRGWTSRRQPADRSRRQCHHAARARPACGRARRSRTHGGTALLHRWLPGRLGQAAHPRGAHRSRPRWWLRPRLGDRKTNFEVIVGRSVPEDRDARYVGLVHGYDSKPKRRLFDVLKSQGLQANQDVTFLTDGGEEVRALTELVTPGSEHVLDWFHITMRVTVLEQYARGVAHHDEAAGTRLRAELERSKWLLWHGNQHRAQEAIEILEEDVAALEVDYPNLRKFAKSVHEFAVYIRSNTGSLINYGERFRNGERISSCLAESTVNAVISKRFAKRQQMQWTKRGAHLLLQTRTRALDGTLRPLFEKWYPGLANDNLAAQAAAA
jgi:hypothetical protein